MVLITAAVRTGKVLFHNNRVALGGLSNGTGTSFDPAQVAGLASPKPCLSRVFTEMNTMSASAIAASTAVEKQRLRSRVRPKRRQDQARKPATDSGLDRSRHRYEPD